MNETSRREKQLTTDQHLAYAEASLMLVEGLMQALLQKKLLTIDEIQSVIDSAIETKQAFVEAGIHPEISNLAGGVLRRLANSVSATPETRYPD